MTTVPIHRIHALAGLMGSCAITALLFQAQAQTPQPAPQPAAAQPAETEKPAEAAKPEAASAETIVVTGSRVRQPGLTSPQPITTVTGSELKYSGNANIIETLDTLPALLGSIDQSSSTMARGGGVGEGLNVLNLRNLGTNRTLVLVNGRRHVGSSTGDTSVDINTIPSALIDRVDVLTGGASALYGADAVTGAVNFILKRKFEGYAFNFDYGVSSRGDADAYSADITYGVSTDDDRGHLMISGAYRRQLPLFPADREFTAEGTSYLLVDNPAEAAVAGDDLAIPDKVYLRDVRYFDSAPDSVVIGMDGIFGIYLTGAYVGSGVPRDPGNPLSAPFQQGGNSTPVARYATEVMPAQNVMSLNIMGDYQISPKARFFTELKFVRNRSQSHFQPSFDFLLPVRFDNPYLPQAIRDNVTPIPAGALGYDPALGDYYFANRDNLDLGYRGANTTRDTYRFVVGFDGDLNDHLSYEVSYNFGNTTSRTLSLGNRLNDRWFAAMDAYRLPSGQIVCRSDVFPNDAQPDLNTNGTLPIGNTFTPGPNSGCVPINIFQDGPISKEAQAWILQDTPTKELLEQQVASAVLNYDTGAWFELPGGPIKTAVGLEWRREHSENLPDPIFTAGYTFGNKLKNTVGSYEAFEAFGELLFPILKDATFAKELSLNVSGRWARYSTAGETFSWTVAGLWAPVEDIRFRASYARAVRAPNIGELFTPEQQSFYLPQDPCDQTRRNQGTSFRPANCDAALTALTIAADSTATFNGQLTASFPGLVRGNTGLKSETADTLTFGAVIRPSFIEGLSLSVDYWKVEIEDGIITPSSQDIINACYDAPSLVNDYCVLLSRVTPAEVTPQRPLGQLDSLTVQAVNIASFKSSGIDFEGHYRFDLADLVGGDEDLGKIHLKAVGSWLETLSLQTTVGGVYDDEVGEASTLLGNGAPKWAVNFGLEWSNDKWSVGYGYVYRTGLLVLEKTAYAAKPDQQELPFTKAKHEHSLNVRYTIDESVELYGGVNNLFDQQPTVGSTATPTGPIGRFFFAGVSVRLGGDGK